jgi:hypothetical protein
MPLGELVKSKTIFFNFFGCVCRNAFVDIAKGSV